MLQQEDRLSSDVMLSDGTLLSQLVDRERREVSLRVHHDPEIFELEMERIFTHSWIPVAHESEIPNPGDYVRRYIGQDSCLVVRGDDGEVNILLNVCPHRGMSICREEEGNSRGFTCPYHGWSFDKQGTFRGAPFEREMYGDLLRRESDRLVLTKARVGNISGLLFANWDPDAEDFDDYLGEFKWYIDAMFKRTDGGLTVIGPPQRQIMKSNWKLVAEQIVDAYHSRTLHQSLGQLGVFGQNPTDSKSWGLGGINVASSQGHLLRCVNLKEFLSIEPGAEDRPVMEKLAGMPPPGVDANLLKQLPGNLTEGQLNLLAETPPAVMGLFPGANFFSFLSHDGTEAGGLGPIMMAHAWIPKTPALHELVSWVLVERDASQELRELTRRATIRTFGISGIIEQDDAEAWRGVQRSVGGPMGRRSTGKYNARLGINRPDDFEGGGDVYAGTSRDDAQWAWWSRYFDVMTS